MNRLSQDHCSVRPSAPRCGWRFYHPPCRCRTAHGRPHRLWRSAGLSPRHSSTSSSPSCRRRRRGAAPAGGRRREKAAGAGKTGRVSSSAWWTSFARPPCHFSSGCGAVRETGGMAASAGRAVAMQGHQNPNLLTINKVTSV